MQGCGNRCRTMFGIIARTIAIFKRDSERKRRVHVAEVGGALKPARRTLAGTDLKPTFMHTIENTRDENISHTANT
jgi:hypothetical protein